MSKLSVVDFAFLALETAASPRHVAGLAVFDRGLDKNQSDLRDLLARMKRVAPAPPFNQKLDISLMSTPRWVEDPDIDLDWHVRHVALPKPGGIDQLTQIVSRLHSTMLDRSRPLWEFYLIEGLQGGHFAIYFKVHHAYMDGVSMSKRVAGTLNESAEDGSLTPIWGTKVAKPKITAEERNLFSQFVGGLKGAGIVLGSIPTLGGLALAHWLKMLGLKDAAMPVPFTAPRTQLNEPVTPARSAAMANVQLSRIKRVAAEVGVTINDVLLSVCDSALLAYLEGIGQTPDEPLVAQMPISLRREGEARTGNQITIALVELSTEASDPIKRLKAISRQAAEVKGEFGRMSESAATAYTVLLQSVAQATEVVKASRFLPPLGNILISNVVGPKQNLYLNGSKLVGLYPISTIPPGVSANITFYTTGGVVYAGIIAGREAIPDLQLVADQMVKSFDELEVAVKKKRQSKKRRKRKMTASGQEQ